MFARNTAHARNTFFWNNGWMTEEDLVIQLWSDSIMGIGDSHFFGFRVFGETFDGDLCCMSGTMRNIMQFQLAFMKGACYTR